MILLCLALKLSSCLISSQYEAIMACLSTIWLQSMNSARISRNVTYAKETAGKRVGWCFLTFYSFEEDRKLSLN